MILEDAISNLVEKAVTLPEGRFTTLAGFWFWLLADHPKREFLRVARGAEAVRFGRRLRSRNGLREKAPEFQSSIFSAVLARIREHADVAAAMEQSQLPLLPILASGAVTEGVEDHVWLAAIWAECRRRIQSGLPMDVPSLAELQTAAGDSDDEVRVFVSHEMARRFRGLPSGLEVLRKLCLEDVSPLVRIQAAVSIAAGWSSQPSASQIISTAALREPDWRVRRRFGHLLLNHWDPKDVAVLSYCREARTDVHRKVRQTAGRASRVRMPVLGMLESSNPAIRRRGVQKSIRSWMEPILWAAIRQMVSREQEPAVIEALLDRIPTGVMQQTGAAWTLVLDLSRREARSVRLATLRTARRLATPPPEFLITLRYWAAHDPDSLVRAEALRQLIDVTPEPIGLRELLRERRDNDSEASIRASAAVSLRDRGVGDSRAVEEWNHFRTVEKAARRFETAVDSWLSASTPSAEGVLADVANAARRRSDCEEAAADLVRSPLSPRLMQDLSRNVVDRVCLRIGAILSLHERTQEAALPPGPGGLSSETWGRHILRGSRLGPYILAHSSNARGGATVSVYRFTLVLDTPWRRFIDDALDFLHSIYESFSRGGFAVRPISETAADRLLGLITGRKFCRGRGALEAELLSGVDAGSVARLLVEWGYLLPERETDFFRCYSIGDPNYPPAKSAFSVEDEEAFRCLLVGAVKGGGKGVLELLRRFELDEEAEVRALIGQLMPQVLTSNRG